jgi:protoporphyrin/coproporphyrin ferrochelatase
MDAVLLVSFGGPESMAEVMPFLRRVTSGRNVPEERLLAVAEHYYARDGVSPINAQNRALLQALAAELAPDGLKLYWGNRNSAPWLADVMQEMADDGVTRAVAVFTSAYSSYSGCRQYRENLADAATRAPEVEVLKIPAYYNSPGFVAANLEHLLTTLRAAAPDAHVLFTTHSIPVGMARASGPGGGQYTAQHEALAGFLMAEVAAQTGRRDPWELVFQSRSGPPQVPWLEPDINDRLRQLRSEGATSVVVAPIGFVSDHMEVVQDLDTEAAQTAAGLGLGYHRVPTVGDHPAFVRGLADSVRAVRAGRPGPTVFGEPLPTPCHAGCCPNPREQRPALCEEPA